MLERTDWVVMPEGYGGETSGQGRPMKLLIVGATGRAGRMVKDQAMARGHRVTAVVRKPGTLSPRPNLRIAVADPMRAADLTQVLPRHDAVISCLGQRSGADAGILENGAAAMLEAMTRSGVRRYLVVSQGLLFPSRNPIVALLRTILRRHVEDSAAMESLVQASDTDWTIVRPPRLLEGGVPRGHQVKAGAMPGGAWAMQYADLAAFLVDAAETQEYAKAIVGVAPAKAEKASESRLPEGVPAISEPSSRAHRS